LSAQYLDDRLFSHGPCRALDHGRRDLRKYLLPDGSPGGRWHAVRAAQRASRAAERGGGDTKNFSKIQRLEP
jgi:hypothetical protein